MNLREACLLLITPVVAAAPLACTNEVPRNDAVAQSELETSPVSDLDELPPPVIPEWFTVADLEQMAKPFENDDEASEAFFNDLDFFVMAAAALPDETRADTVAGSVLMVKYNLHRLYYDVSFDKTAHPAEDPEFYRTLATFEQRAGLNVDGMFTLGEYTRLAFLAEVESEPAIRTSIKFVTGGDSYASAKGTWALQGERIAYPVNRSNVVCWRADGSCTVFTANVLLPDRDRVSGLLLMTDSTYYDIVGWTESQVVARSSTSCRQTTLTVNWKAEQVHMVSTDVSKDGCPVVGPLTKPRLATLEDNAPVEAFLKERKEMSQGVTNSPLTRIRSLMAGQEQ